MISEDVNWVKYSEWSENLLSYVVNGEDAEHLFSLFSKLDCNQQRAEFCFSDEHEFIPKKVEQFYVEHYSAEQTATGPGEDSKKLCAVASSYTKKGFYDKASKYYTEALARCVRCTPNERPDVGTIYANRSACFFNLQNYEKALDDVEFAFVHNSPDSLRSNLILRKVKCLLSLGKKEEAKKFVDETLEKCPELSDIAEQLIQILMKEVKIHSKEEDEGPVGEEEFGTGCFANGSKKLSVNESAEKGRFVVAAEDIEIGTVLFQEEPYSSILSSTRRDGHCSHCLSFIEEGGCLCLICGHSYCTFACFNKDKELHAVECPQLIRLLDDIGIASIALRLVLTKGLTNAIAEYEKFRSSSTRQVSYPSDYTSILELCDHQNEFSALENVQFTLTALFLWMALKKNSIQGSHEAVNDHLVVELLLKHLQQLSTNSIAVLEQNLVQDTSGGVGKDNAEEEIGIGIYPNISLLNHSCQPNVVAFFEGSKLTLQSSAEIKRGQEVNFCYGPSVRSMTRKDRQETLKKQYFFDCMCQPCESGVETKGNALRCVKCTSGPLIYNRDLSCHCLECGAEGQDIRDLLVKLEECAVLSAEGKELMEKDELEEAVSKISQAHNLMDKFLHRQNRQMMQVKDDLCQCLALMGHYEMASKYSMYSTRTLEQVHGAQSIQVAFELQKACSLKWNYIEELLEEDADSSKVLVSANELLPLVERVLGLYTNFNIALEAKAHLADLSFGFSNQIDSLQDKKQNVISLIGKLSQ